MAKKGGYSANDMRSMVNNPNSSHYAAAHTNHSNQHNTNNASYQAAVDNRSNQLNPNHSKSKG
jgi:hypothetical protein